MPIGTGAHLLAQDTRHLTTARVVITDQDQSAPSVTYVTSALSLPLLAYSKYYLRCLIAVDAATAADMAYRFDLPANATMTRSVWGSSTGAGAGVLDETIFHNRAADPGPGVIGGTNVGTVMTARVTGVIRTAAIAGFVTFRFAQNTANASPAVLKTDSMMWAIRG